MGKTIDLEMHRGPGRVRTPARRPSARRLARTEVYNRELDKFAAVDAVVLAAGGDPMECLYEARDAVAHEAAALLWQRKQAVPGSREAARISTRRIAALAEVGSLTLAINRANPGYPSPARIERVLTSLREEIESTIRELFDETTADGLLLKLVKRLRDVGFPLQNLHQEGHQLMKEDGQGYGHERQKR